MGGKDDNRQKYMDTDFLATMDLYESSSFSFFSASSYYARDTFVSENDNIEDIFPCVFIAKVQNHGVDNPTYENILRGSSTEKTAQ